MAKILVSFSGGLDSTCLLTHLMKEHKHTFYCVGFFYGSKHNQYENMAAKAICRKLDVPFQLIDMSGVFKGFKSNLLKSGGDIPEGHYQEESMTQTVVPARNLIFASVLIGLANSLSMDTVALGIHAGDHAIYPDCRPLFYNDLESVSLSATDNAVRVIAPFLYHTKTEVLSEGLLSHAPLHLTRTCYKDQPIACGKCGSCIERLEAFEENIAWDPIEYEGNTNDTSTR